MDAGGKVVVHDYGHGGAGFTLSWGSASLVADLLRGHPRGTEVAVLGSGVLGLSTSARVLQERGFRVRIYAREFPPHTTSDVAGAEWSPDLVDRGDTPLLRAQVRSDAGHLVAAVSDRSSDPAGASAHGPSTRRRGSRAVWTNCLPACCRRRGRSVRCLSRRHVRGRVYQTLLIEAPIFLSRLVAEVKRGGAALESQAFGGPGELGRASRSR